MTIYSLLLGLLLGLGIRMWDADRQDDCALYLAGIKGAPASVLVVSGSRQIEVSCNNWLMRQPMKVQLTCLIDLVIFVVFFLNALSDLQQWLQMRRRMGGKV